jgi:hypothetical protein
VTRFKSTFRFVLPLAVLLATTAVSTVLTTTPAQAWDPTWQSSDGSVTLWYQEGSDGRGVFVVTIEKDGKFGVYFEKAVVDAVFDKMDNSNPNPADDTGGKGTSKPSVDELLKIVKDAAAVIVTTPINSKLGGIIEQGGGGKVPHWNPGDGDDNGPSNPPSSKGEHHPGQLTAEQLKNRQALVNKLVRQAALGKGGMFDGSEGGTESAPGLDKHGGTPKNVNNGQGHGDEDGDGNNDYKSPYIPQGEDLGPKPELVNPNPVLKAPGAIKTTKLGTVSVKKQDLGASNGKNKTEGGKTEGGKTVKTAGKTAGGPKIMAPGLLDAGTTGFSGGSAPSSMGAMPAGGAHTTRLR